MPTALDFIARVDDDGRLSRAAALRVKHNLTPSGLRSGRILEPAA